MSHPMRDFARILTDARNALGPPDIYPTRADPRFAQFPPRVTGPALPWLLMGGCFGLGLATGLIAAVVAMILQAPA
jgi:hypothetical protein